MGSSSAATTNARWNRESARGCGVRGAGGTGRRRAFRGGRNEGLMAGAGSQVREDASPRERAASGAAGAALWVRFRAERPGSPPSSAAVPRGGREWTAALGRGARVAGLL